MTDIARRSVVGRHDVGPGHESGRWLLVSTSVQWLTFLPSGSVKTQFDGDSISGEGILIASFTFENSAGDGCDCLFLQGSSCGGSGARLRSVRRRALSVDGVYDDDKTYETGQLGMSREP